MTDLEPERAWAAAWTHDPELRPFILAHTTGSTRQAVLRHMGEAWGREGETWRQGWRRAYKRGCRVIRVTVAAAS